MEAIIEFVTQIEVLGSVATAGGLFILNAIRKQFVNGTLVSAIVTYASKKFVDMITSDKPEVREKANVVVDALIALPQIQTLFTGLTKNADDQLAVMESELANIMVKLEVGTWSKEVTEQLIKAKESLQTRINEINS